MVNKTNPKGHKDVIYPPKGLGKEQDFRAFEISVEYMLFKSWGTTF